MRNLPALRASAAYNGHKGDAAYVIGGPNAGRNGTVIWTGVSCGEPGVGVRYGAGDDDVAWCSGYDIASSILQATSRAAGPRPGRSRSCSIPRGFAPPHGQSPWGGHPNDSLTLIDPEVMAIPGMAPLVPRFSMLVEDLENLSNDALQARSLGAFQQLTLWLLRDSRDSCRLLSNFDA